MEFLVMVNGSIQPSWEKNGDTNKLAFFHANHMESKNL